MSNLLDQIAKNIQVQFNELKIISDEYQKEVYACFEIAQRLDSLNPTLSRAFTGTPSERIKRQLTSMKIRV